MSQRFDVPPPHIKNKKQNDMPPSRAKNVQKNDMPPSRERDVQRNDSPPSNRKYKKWLIVSLIICFVIVLSVGVILFSVSKINRDMEVNTTDAPIVTQIVSQSVSQPASQLASGSNDDIAGAWRIDHFVVNGEIVSGDSGIDFTYIYTFNADGSVTRDSGAIDTGNYVRDGNVITATFDDRDYEFIYSAAAKSMTVNIGDVISVYGKDGQPIQEVTEPAASAR